MRGDLKMFGFNRKKFDAKRKSSDIESLKKEIVLEKAKAGILKEESDLRGELSGLRSKNRGEPGIFSTGLKVLGKGIVKGGASLAKDMYRRGPEISRSYNESVLGDSGFMPSNRKRVVTKKKY